MNQPDETIEISGPNNGRWYFTQIPDWIALHPDLKDAAFRLYIIIRSLVMEKQDDHVRKLTHDEIAYMMVGKNGKPSTVSTVKALLRNLEDVGLIEHPDGTRMASPTGRGDPNAKLRYRLNDWPDKQSYDGWRNAFDKLDWYTEDWPETRTDIAGEGYAAWLAGEEKASPPRKAHDRGEEKASPQAKENIRLRRSFSSQDSPVTSGNASSNKPLQEAPSISSSSPPNGHADAEPTPAPKKTKKTNEDDQDTQAAHHLTQRLTDAPGGPPTPDEAAKVLEHVRAQAARSGTPHIHRIHTWITRRETSALLADLAHVRNTEARSRVDVCGLHPGRKTLPCRPCEVMARGGLLDELRAELARVGHAARPDLARVLGEHQHAAA